MKERQRVWDGLVCATNGGIDAAEALERLGIDKAIREIEDGDEALLPLAQIMLQDFSDRYFELYGREIDWRAFNTMLEMTLSIRSICQSLVARQLDGVSMSHMVILDPGNPQFNNIIRWLAEQAGDLIIDASQLAKDQRSVTEFSYDIIGLAFGYAGPELQNFVNSLHTYLTNYLYLYEGGNAWACIDDPSAIKPFSSHSNLPLA